jgi:hypothetical protein
MAGDVIEPARAGRIVEPAACLGPGAHRVVPPAIILAGNLFESNCSINVSIIQIAIAAYDIRTGQGEN